MKVKVFVEIIKMHIALTYSDTHIPKIDPW